MICNTQASRSHVFPANKISTLYTLQYIVSLSHVFQLLVTRFGSHPDLLIIAGDTLSGWLTSPTSTTTQPSPPQTWINAMED